MARSRAERYTARALRFLSRAILAVLGLVARASSFAAPLGAPSPSPVRACLTGCPAAAAVTTAAASTSSRNRRSVPPPTEELLLLSGVELARRIRRKEVRGAGRLGVGKA